MGSAEKNELRTAVPSGSPDGIPASARRRTGSPAQMFAACIAGAVVLALLSPPDSPSWSDRGGDRPVTAALRGAAAEWADRVARLGLTLPHQALRRTVRRLIELQWR